MVNWLVFLWSITVASAVLASGGAVGNGGGFAKCSDDRYYSYDYILTRRQSDQPSWQDRKGLTFGQQLQTIQGELVRLGDPLANDLGHFIQSMFTQKAGNEYQWFVRNNLMVLWEPGLDEALPQNCRTRIQAVHYFPKFGGLPHATYAFDPQVVEKVRLQSDGDLQVSYLWVHEWLWNHFEREDFIKLSRFNQFLHSDQLLKISPSEYFEMKKKLVK